LSALDSLNGTKAHLFQRLVIEGTSVTAGNTKARQKISESPTPCGTVSGPISSGNTPPQLMCGPGLVNSDLSFDNKVRFGWRCLNVRAASRCGGRNWDRGSAMTCD